MLVGILALYFYNSTGLKAVGLPGLGNAPTFDVTELFKIAPQIPPNLQMWVFLAFFVGFAIKVPMFPFHTWLPDAHVEAPTAGSVILAGVLLKMGTYGFIRFSLPLLPKATLWAQWWMVTLAIIGIIYGALVAMAQKDMKKLVAYSSVSHLGFVMLGILTFTAAGVQGGIYQMLAHGISTGGLFLAVGILYERRHTRKLADFGGLWARMPVFGACFLVIVLASAGLPGLCGFVGEFLVLIGTFNAGKAWQAADMAPAFAHPALLAAISATAVILAAVYLLTMFQKVMFGPLDKPENRDEKVRDLSWTEKVVFGIVVIFALGMGVAPGPILSRSAPSVDALLEGYRGRLAEALAKPEAPARMLGPGGAGRAFVPPPGWRGPHGGAQ
jgi:NADH-quinone oxidoreductase subunit M